MRAYTGAARGFPPPTTFDATTGNPADRANRFESGGCDGLFFAGKQAGVQRAAEATGQGQRVVWKADHGVGPQHGAFAGASDPLSAFPENISKSTRRGLQRVLAVLAAEPFLLYPMWLFTLSLALVPPQISKTGITFGAENAGTGDTTVMGKLAKVK